MSSIAIDTDSWNGCTLVDRVHHKLGTIEEISMAEEVDDHYAPASGSERDAPRESVAERVPAWIV